MTLLEVVSYAQIVTPIVLLLGFGFAYYQLLEMRKQIHETQRMTESARRARMAQVIDSLSEFWESEVLRRGRKLASDHPKVLKDHFLKIDQENSDEYYYIAAVANFMDTLGVVVKEGFLDCSIAFDIFHRAEDHYFQLFRDYLQDQAHKDELEYWHRLHRLFQTEGARRLPEQSRPSD